MVRPPGTTSLIHKIMVNPAQCSLVILSETPIDIQGVHSGKVQDNNTTSPVLKNYVLLL